jgi:acyl carrier protein
VRQPLAHRIALDVLVQMWSNKGLTFQTDAYRPLRRVIDTTKAPKAVEKTLLTPGLWGQMRALALERGTTFRHDSRSGCRCKDVHLVISAQLETVLRRNLVLVQEGQNVPLETELPALGLDSMSALTLLLELEEIFDVSFPDSLLNATTFRSAKSLENAIQMLRKERIGHRTGHLEIHWRPDSMNQGGWKCE